MSTIAVSTLQKLDQGPQAPDHPFAQKLRLLTARIALHTDPLLLHKGRLDL
jgi:hypothetical protein